MLIEQDWFWRLYHLWQPFHESPMSGIRHAPHQVGTVWERNKQPLNWIRLIQIGKKTHVICRFEKFLFSFETDPKFSLFKLLANGGYRRKKSKQEWVWRCTFLKRPPGTFRFSTLPSEIPEKTRFYLSKICKIVWHPLKIPSSKPRAIHGNFTWIFFNITGNSTYFLIDSWNFHMLFLWCLWKFHVLKSLLFEIFCNTPFLN